MKELLHVAVGGCRCLIRTAPVLAGAQVGRVPISPIMFRVRLLVRPMVLLSLPKKLCKGRGVDGSCLLLLPFAAGKARRDLLEQPAVSIWILK